MTDLSRPHLKRAIVNRLDAVAREHRLGHQDAYANRYSMRSDDDAPVEMMFEKDPDTEPHLWVLAEQVASIPKGTIPAEFYSKDDLYNVPAKNGDMQYGRHSALEKMTWLGKADLVRFTLRSVADLDHIVSVLMQAQRRKQTET
ncbi:MAG: hypothetical protein HLUCCO07_16295 [Rhodobacteraceae bacterium HLUCCO07]|nr:MAG: hypothetical protein HLUCCO07_16295 [Rhodobacteraceae bacterium HLUCCO07]